MRLLDTLLWEGQPHGNLRVQQPQHMLPSRRRGNVEARLSRPRRLDAVHRQGSEVPEQSQKVVDGLAGLRGLCEVVE